MRILALITARGGSKRLPGKNILPLAGKPLIQWTIDTALGLPTLCHVLLSTDDPAIAEVGRAGGAYVPWLRPADLASDTASGTDVALHALDWYEAQHGAVDGLLLLQPTSPFRTRTTIAQGIALFDPALGGSVIGVSPAPSHPMWTFKLEGDRLVPFVPGDGLQTRSQDLPPAYVVNGTFYLTSPQRLRTEKTFFSKDALALVIASAQEALDIDTPQDFALAQYYVEQNSELLKVRQGGTGQ